MRRYGYYLVFFNCLLWSACQHSTDDPQHATIPPLSTLFTTIPAAYSGIDFVNQADYTEEFNVYTFRNFYNGAGVALGDLNNDGLVDIYFCGNIQDNKLYLNQGDFKFKDVTAAAGVACPNVWSSGVSLADVNGDGWLDIYVCKSGSPTGENRHNELFINNQDGTFTERAKAYGIGDTGLSVHAAFFDYDKDGDLDCYLLNNSFSPVTGYDLQRSDRNVRDPQGGNKLYRNDGGTFTEVSAAAGIYSSAIGFGLGVTIGDVNRDGWQDIFVSNDFFEKDYLYINQQDGTFKEDLEQQIREISMGSMGADMADINNDGYPEIFVTEMLPEHNRRIKTKTAFENWDKYQLNLKNGYYHQFTRNVLQLNNRNGSFSEISRLAGVHATDWSWGALIADLDNDGWKDIFVANGIYKDLTDQDYISFYSDPRAVRAKLQEGDGGILNLIDAIPSERIANYAFQNQADSIGFAQPVQFQNKATEWGLATPSHSNGSAYADLDNDGDLDLVVNNMNMPPFVYRNEADTLLNHHYLTLQLVGAGQNKFGLGAQVTLFAGQKTWYQEVAPMRGFESTVDQRLSFGLGKVATIDSVVVVWNDQTRSVLTNVAVDRILKVEQADSETPRLLATESERQRQTPVFKPTDFPNAYRHTENQFVDFDRDRLTYQMFSAEGPKMCKGDVNGDGREDVFIGGAKDSAGQLFLQAANGSLQPLETEVFTSDKVHEDLDCAFFDADNDGDLDLLVASGGNEFPTTSSALKDRLYLNNGRGKFTKSKQFFPYESTGCVATADFDNDGDIDIFTGARLRPFLYGVPVNGTIWQNDGKGNFKNTTSTVAPELQNLGLLTDAKWFDYDNDRDLDLIITGEWMAITIFNNENGRLRKTDAGLEAANGFWSCVEIADLDQDGNLDLVLGNHGKNTRLQAAANRPVEMYINDYDQNGTAEQILTAYNGDQSYPFALRHDLVMQLPQLKKKYLKYDAYKNATIDSIFTPEQISAAVHLVVNTTATSVALNRGDGTFELRELPLAAQLAPTYGIAVHDFDRDGQLDILLGGNFYRSKPEVGIYDASYGTFLRGDGMGNFTVVPNAQSGFSVKGEIRDLLILNNQRQVVVARNNATVQLFDF